MYDRLCQIVVSYLGQSIIIHVNYWIWGRLYKNRGLEQSKIVNPWYIGISGLEGCWQRWAYLFCTLSLFWIQMTSLWNRGLLNFFHYRLKLSWGKLSFDARFWKALWPFSRPLGSMQNQDTASFFLIGCCVAHQFGSTTVLNSQQPRPKHWPGSTEYPLRLTVNLTTAHQFKLGGILKNPYKITAGVRHFLAPNECKF